MHDHQARAVCGASVVGDEEEYRDPDARSSGGDGLRPEVAAENEIIEEFEPRLRRTAMKERRPRSRGDCEHRWKSRRISETRTR